MAKLTNVRERTHQPFRDTLIRTSGLYASNVQDRTDLFTRAGGDDGQTNLKNGSTLPSDQSMVVLALRVFTWFRASVIRGAYNDCGRASPTPILSTNGDIGSDENFCSGPGPTILNGQASGDYHDVYRLHWQAEEQLLWSFGSGQKLSLISMPTAYFPYGGGLWGDMGHAGTNCCAPQLSLGVGSGTNASVASIVGNCCSGCWLIVWKGRSSGTTCPMDVLYLPNCVYDRDAVLVYNNDSYEIGTEVPVGVAVGAEPCISVALPALPPANGDQVWVLGNSGGSGTTGCQPLIHWENGTPDHGGILRLARAVLLPPRQNILAQAQIVRLPDGGNSGKFGATQGWRNLLSLTDNLNAVDGIQKVVSFTLDGLFSRDVQ